MYNQHRGGQQAWTGGAEPSVKAVPVPLSLLEDGQAQLTHRCVFLSAGVRRANQGGEPLPGAAPGEGGGDRRAEG